MKRLLILGAVFISSLTYGQDYWRTLTLRNTSGLTANANYLNTFSAMLDYQINAKFAVESWNGVNYHWGYDNGWVSSQTTMNLLLKKNWIVGGGLLLNGGMAPGGVLREYDNENAAIIFVIQKRFKL
jgi:hypothetical protein